MKQSFRSIFISNILETYYHGYQTLPNKEKAYWYKYDTLLANRALLHDADNKLVVTSKPINPQHFQNIAQLLHWKNVVNLTPSQPSVSICEDILKSGPLQTQIISLIRQNPGINIIPYLATQQFYDLLKFFAQQRLKFTTPETLAESQRFINHYLNCKRGFRHLWAQALLNQPKLNISLPDGFICGDKTEAIEAGWWFQQQGRSFAIKYNYGVQGINIIFNKATELPKERTSFIAALEDKMRDQIWHEPAIIVEEMIEIDQTKLGGSPNVEFFINPAGKVEKLYSCIQILDDDHKTFRGVYINPEVDKDPRIQIAYQAGLYYGKAIAALGYRGFFDMDLVVSKTNKLYAVEANLRRTGGTHVRQTAVSILGKDYLKKYHIVSEEIALSRNTPTNYQECYNLLKDLMYDPKKKSGFIFENPDMLEVNILYGLFFAGSEEEMTQLRREVKSRIKNLR